MWGLFVRMIDYKSVIEILFALKSYLFGVSLDEAPRHWVIMTRFPDKVMVSKRRENIAQWHVVTSQKHG
jgi:hypothetical protein